jgi:phospholipid transport system substrate-binding protein
MKRIVPMVFILSLALSAHSECVQPMETLKGGIDRVIAILEDPTYKDPSQGQTKDKRIWDVIQGIFDFNEMTRSALAQHGREFTEEQKNELSEVFGRHLGNLYLEKIESGFKGERVTYLGCEMVGENRAQVDTKIIRNNSDIPVDYKMMKQGGVWKVYDVKIEGIGDLIYNYRRQFHSILSKESPDTLINLLKRKIKEEKQ